MKIPSAIAIDGPAASGKTTLAVRLAQELGYLYFDTGVMYRAITWIAIQRKIDPVDATALTKLAEMTSIDVRPPSQQDGRNNDVLVEGKDITWEIRQAEVEAHVSPVSAIRGVRQALTAQQRMIGQRGTVVMVGRDIGTVVLPEADMKIYLDASAEARAQRRVNELIARGQPALYEEILTAMRERDRIDSTRQVAPLRPAEDALILVSDHLDAQQIFELVLFWVQHPEILQGTTGLGGKFDLVTVLSDQVPKMVNFYRDVLGFIPGNEQGNYIEFEHHGVRFAICARRTMYEATRNPSFQETPHGQKFELAIPLETCEAVDLAFAAITARGAMPIAPPATMPWGQRTAFFADPDGNIHELYANLADSS